MNVPRRQHFIPRFLLNNFAYRKNGDEVFVWMFRKGVLAKEVNTKNLAHERDFYGHPESSELEFRIGEHESQFAPMVERLRKGDLRKGDDEMIRHYIAHLTIRTKHVRAGAQAAIAEFIDKAREAVPTMKRRKMKHQIKKEARKQFRESGLSELIKRLPRHQRKIMEDKLNRMVKELDIRPQLAELLGQFKQLPTFNDMGANGQLKAMNQTVVPKLRAESIVNLEWEILLDDPGTWILGDVAVFGRFCGSDEFRSLLNSVAPVEMVITPLSDNACLVGRSSKAVVVPDPERVNAEAAELSCEFIVASRNSEPEARYHQRIGMRSEVILEGEILEAVRDLTL
jgi:hypothetical protein